MPETELNRLLESMNPRLIDKEFVFCAVHDFSSLTPLLIFKENEGTTVIIRKTEADANSLSYSATWALITLSVNSDLEAVGFLAKITEKLAEAVIPVNVVSAYYHDHLFVPYTQRKEALLILKKLAQK